MSSINGLLVAGDDRTAENEEPQARLSPERAAQSENDNKPAPMLDVLELLILGLPGADAAGDDDIQERNQLDVESNNVEKGTSKVNEDKHDEKPQHGNNTNDRPSNVNNPSVPNVPSPPPKYRNPNTFFQRRTNETLEDFRARLLGMTWAQQRRLLGISKTSPRENTALPSKDSKLPATQKCKACTDFDLYAPHLNDRRECTCDDNIPRPENSRSENCTVESPCTTCELLIAKGKADCKDCRERNSIHSHTMHCFNCVCHVLLKSQAFHRATITSAQIVSLPMNVTPENPAGMAIAPTYDFPSSPASDFSDGDTMCEEEPNTTAGHVDPSIPAAASPNGIGFDSETEIDEDEEDEQRTATTSHHSLSPPSIDAIVAECTQQVGRITSPPPHSSPNTNTRKRRHSQPSSPTPEPRSSSPDPIPRTLNHLTHVPKFQYIPARSPSPTALDPAPFQNIIDPVRYQSVPAVDVQAIRSRRLRQSDRDVRARRAFCCETAGCGRHEECMGSVEGY